MTSFLISLLIFLLCFFVFTQILWIRHLHQARKRGIYPLSAQATLFDVKRLITAGENILAVRLYREIYKGTSFKDAQKAVVQIEKGIKAKREHYS
ncbi:MAG TPA: hypothetical protein VJA17_00055 [Candidatus Omnitrophota bacterium]|nr:hypothetical protein [Candidatus Omnitrophota bacterium]